MKTEVFRAPHSKAVLLFILAAASFGIMLGPSTAKREVVQTPSNGPMERLWSEIRKLGIGVIAGVPKASALLRDSSRVQEYCKSISSGELRSQSNELDDLVRHGIVRIYSDVNGVVDRWWRYPVWMTRSVIRHIATPTRVSVVLARRRAEQTCRSLSRLRETVAQLECPESIAAIDALLCRSDACPRLTARQDAESSLAGFFDHLGDQLHSEFENAGFLESRASIENKMFVRAAQSFTELLNERTQAAPLFSPEEFERARLSANCSQERVRELDRTASRIIILHCLCESRDRAITEIERFLSERLHAQPFDDFYDDLLGPWDAMVIAFETKGTIELDSTLRERFDQRVVSMANVTELCDRIRRHYDQGVNQAAKQIFDELRESPITYPRVTDLAHRIELQSLNGVDLGDGAFLRTQVLSGAVELPLLAADVTLIIAGIVGAPETAGISLIATVAGALHMLFDTSVQAMAVAKNDLQITAIRCTTQSTIVASVLGTDGVQAMAGNSPLILNTQQAHRGAMATCEAEMVRNLNDYLIGLTTR